MKIKSIIIEETFYIELTLDNNETELINKTDLYFKLSNHYLFYKAEGYNLLYFLANNKANILEVKDLLLSLCLIKPFDFPNIQFESAINDVKDDFERIICTNEYKNFAYIINNNILREPKEFQMQGAYLNIQKKRLLNFSTPGSGKTMTCNITYAFLKYNNLVNKMVIICPKNAFNTWANEIYIDMLNDEICYIDANINGIDLEKEIYIVNYEKIQNSNVLKFLETIIDSQTYVVFDELHRLKNPNGKRSSNFITCLKQVTYATMLSGSPIPNGVSDLFFPIQILFNGSSIEFNKNDFVNIHATKLKLYPYYYHVNKQQLNIPIPLEDKKYYYKVNKFEQDLIKEIAKKQFYFLYKYIIIQKLLVTPKYLLDVEYFHQGYKVPLIYGEEELEYIEQKVSDNKFNLLIDVIDDLQKENKSIIIWCTFVKTIEKLHSFYGESSQIIYGNTPLDERNEIINSFNSGEIKILITNYATMAESVSLHHTCHDAIFFEYSFNLVHFVQAKDRIHRVGVKSYTQYHYILPEQNNNQFVSLDNYILEVLQEKESTMQDFLTAKSVTTEHSNNILQVVEEHAYGIDKLTSYEYNIYQKFKILESTYKILPSSYIKQKLKLSEGQYIELLDKIDFDYKIEDELLFDGGYESIKQLLEENSKDCLIGATTLIYDLLNPIFRSKIANLSNVYYLDQETLCVISEFDAIEFEIIKENYESIDLTKHIEFVENYPKIIQHLNKTYNR